MNHIFPLAFMTNTFAMTVLLIVTGLVSDPAMAADIGIVQGATLALFYAFSANARSLILGKRTVFTAEPLMLGRLILLVPLSAICFWLSAGVAEVNPLLAAILILRRGIEWLGEVHLSEAERLQDHFQARRYLIAQSILLAVVVVCLVTDASYLLLVLGAWAIFPIIFSAKFISHSLSKARRTLNHLVLKLIPHLGSTAIIGITVYVFRLMLLTLMGKEESGDLFTAFAIGGLSGSVFANALGASIALHEQRIGKRYFPAKLRLALTAVLISGLVIFVSALLQLPFLQITQKSYFFWEATGLSLIGGVIMVFAQRIRFRMLQNDEEKDSFGPDVITNILLIASVPFAFYLVGKASMAFLYLLSAVFAYVFYLSARNEGILKINQDKLKHILPLALLFPLFFQASNGLFNDPKMYASSGGKLMNLPVPISVLACYMGIVLLGGYKRAITSYMTIFLTCILMILATLIIASDDLDLQSAKLILLIQFILPMFALSLGQAFSQGSSNTEVGNWLAKAFLAVVGLIVPLQLVATWSQGYPFLAPSVWLFSIYQHLQYVPVALVGGFMIALFVLWEKKALRPLLFFLALLMAIYVAASMSMLAVGFFLLGLFLLTSTRWFLKREIVPAAVLLVSMSIAWGYLQYNKELIAYKYTFLQEQAARGNAADNKYIFDKHLFVPPNLMERTAYWRFYLSEISADAKSLLLGHRTPPDRAKYPSAHNYYLDFIYNFGLIPLLPMLILMGLTGLMLFRHRRRVMKSQELAALAFVVSFLLIGDNSLKVGLRQPYPGILTYFLWGVLLGLLYSMNSEYKQAKVSIP